MARQEKTPRHPTAIYFARKALDMKRVELARKSGIHPQTIQKLEQGIMRIARKWADKLAGPLGRTSEELMYWDRFHPEGMPSRPAIEHIESATIAASMGGQPSATVPLVGYASAGAQTHFYEIAQGDLDRIPAPKDAAKTTVAVEVRGNCLGSILDRAWVYYDEVRRPVTSDLIGRLCVVGLPDGRVLIKQVRRGAHGLFDLISEHADPIRGVGIEWAAPVINIVPRKI